MAAADAGDVAFAGAAFHTQENFAVGALKVLIILTVLHAFDELAGLQFPVGSEINILPVLSNTLFIVAGEHTEDGPDIGSKTDQGEQSYACEAAQQGAGKAADEGEHAEVIGTMAADHETGK